MCFCLVIQYIWAYNEFPSSITLSRSSFCHATAGLTWSVITAVTQLATHCFHHVLDDVNSLGGRRLKTCWCHWTQRALLMAMPPFIFASRLKTRTRSSGGFVATHLFCMALEILQPLPRGVFAAVSDWGITCSTLSWCEQSVRKKEEIGLQSVLPIKCGNKELLVKEHCKIAVLGCC